MNEEKIRIGFILLNSLSSVEKLKLLLLPEDFEELASGDTWHLHLQLRNNKCHDLIYSRAWGKTKKGYYYWVALHKLFSELEESK